LSAENAFAVDVVGFPGSTATTLAPSSKHGFKDILTPVKDKDG